MESTSKLRHRSGSKVDTSSPRKSVAAPAAREQNTKDELEKRKHAASENELESAQNKNPVPPESTRE